MMRVVGIVTGLVMCTGAHAKGPNWFLEGAETVEISEAVEETLLRGRSSGFRPAIRVVHVHDDKERGAIAIVDIGHTWTKIGRRLARQLDLELESTTLDGVWGQVTTLEELRIGGAVIRGLRAEVVEGEDLVLGLGAIPEVAVALLPSTGKVRIVPAAQGRQLVESVGEARPVQIEKLGKYRFAGEKVVGDGLSLAVKGAISGRDGWVGLHTDATTTAVTRRYEATDERRRLGVIHYRGRGRVGDHELPESWVMRDESLSHSVGKYVGALGYDQLYALDLAVSPLDGVAAVAPVRDPQWTSTNEAALELQRERYEAAGYDLEEESDRPPRMTLSDEDETDLEGDPGDRKRREHELGLANALWDAGHLDEALRHYRAASKASGDHCGPHRELGVKRLAWSGSLQQKPFIIELIRQPLHIAGSLWDRWAELPAETRQKIRRYEDVPSGTFKIAQDVRCRTAWGTLMASYVRLGDTRAASRVYKEHHGTDPMVAFAQGLSLIERGQPKTAEIPIREALQAKVAEYGDFKLGLGAAQVAQGLEEPVHALVDEIPGLDLEHGLTAALIVADWGHTLDAENGARELAVRLVKEDRYWIPGQLLGVWLGVEEADRNQLGAELVRQIPRDAGAPKVRIERAVFLALDGKMNKALTILEGERKAGPPTADLFAALAWVHTIQGDDEARDAALLELRLRFPTIPIGKMGVLQSVR